MAEHSEHPPEGATAPGGGTGQAGEDSVPATAEGGAGDRPVAPAAYTSGGESPPKPRSDRFRRWSASASVRMGAVALVAGLVGGLVGGGVVAAFSDDGHDRQVPVRFERGMPRGGPGFRMPRYWDPPGQWVQPGPRRPAQPPQPPLPTQPTPVPSPKTTG